MVSRGKRSTGLEREVRYLHLSFRVLLFVCEADPKRGIVFSNEEQRPFQKCPESSSFTSASVSTNGHYMRGTSETEAVAVGAARVPCGMTVPLSISLATPAFSIPLDSPSRSPANRLSGSCACVDGLGTQTIHLSLPLFPPPFLYLGFSSSDESGSRHFQLTHVMGSQRRTKLPKHQRSLGSKPRVVRVHVSS
ncbi:hypothetical protein NL676_016840 [Syzygium grande]|nr:hypothetical protein NL676_016840 [Syzygium grande]